LPTDKLEKYSNYQIEETIYDKKLDSYYMVEPESIVVDYKKNEQVLSYDNFF